MKKLLLASAGLLALGVVSVSAADLPRQRPMPAKAPVYVPPPYNWTGFYVGINGGGGFGRSEYSSPLSTSFDTSGGLVGGTIGYNYQMGQIVLGVEGDGDWSGIRGSAACGATTCDTHNHWLATARGRLGYAIDRFMPYVTGGAAFGDVNTSISGIGDTKTTRTGWTAGGGIEMAIAGPWTAKLEYLHVDLGNADTALPGTSANFRSEIVRAGVNYRF